MPPTWQLNPPAWIFKQIASSTTFNCWIKSDDTIACWWSNQYGQLDFPSWTYKQISTGNGFACWIKSDDTIACWWFGGNWQTIVPQWTFKQISAWEGNACGIKTNGTYICWGNNQFWLLDNEPTWEFIEISSGPYNACWIKSDGVVECWWRNTEGQSTPPAWLILKTFTSNNLSLTSSYPTDSASQIPITDPISLNFSEWIDYNSIKDNISISAWGNSIAYWIYQSIDKQTLILRPTVYWVFNSNTTYIVNINKNLKGTDWKLLWADKTITFSTEASAWTPNSTTQNTSSPVECLWVWFTSVSISCSWQNYILVSQNQTISLSSQVDTQTVWDPVTLQSWEFVYSNTLMNIPWKWIPYDFSIVNKSQTYYNWIMGINWDFSYNKFLNENSSWSVTYHDWKLWAYTFLKKEDGNFEYLQWINAQLSKNTNGNYELLFKDNQKYVFGENMKIKGISDNNGNSLQFSYDTDWKLTETIDTLWRKIEYSYSDNSRLSKITDFNWKSVELNYYSDNEENWNLYDIKSIIINNITSSKTITFTYTKVANNEVLSHNIISTSDSSWKVYVTNTYDDKDRVQSQIYWNWTINFNYTMNEDNTFIQKTKVVNRKWNTVEYEYDKGWNILSKTIFWVSDKTTVYKYSYDDKWRMAQVINPKWNWTKYSYDEQWNKIEDRKKADMTQSDNDSEDLITKFIYDSTYNKPVEITKPDWTKLNFTLDDKWNITKIETKNINLWWVNQDRSDITILNEYDTNGNLIKTTDPEWNITTYTYENWLLIKVAKLARDRWWVLGFFETSANDIVESYKYDSYGNVVEKTDALWNKTTLTYNEYSNLVSSLSSQWIEKKYIYDANNNITEQNIQLWVTNNPSTKYVYDLLDHPTDIITQIDKDTTNKVTKKYDVNENVSEITQENWVKILFEYDEFERVIKKIVRNPDSTDIISTYSYDNNGNLISTINPKLAETKYEYDSFDRMIKATEPNGNYSLVNYDKAGNVIQVKTFNKDNKLLTQTDNIYNEIWQILKTTNSIIKDWIISWNITNLVKYNKNAKVIESIDAKGNKSSIIYDEFGRATEAQDVLWNKIRNTYDKRWLIIEKDIIQSNSKTIKTIYEYDKDWRLTKQTNNDNKSSSYIYNNLNQVTQTIDANNTKTDYEYNYVGKVTKETKYVNSKPVTTTYTYDKYLNLISTTDWNGNITKYEYDNLWRLTKEIYPDNKFTVYEYDISGNVSKKIDPNWNVVANSYDNLDRLTERNITPWVWVIWVTRETYSYDELWRLIWANDSNNSELKFSYDSLNRLLSETNSNSEIKYSYDELWNLTNTTYPSNRNISRNYDVLNRLTTIANNNETVKSYAYNWLELTQELNSNNTKTNYAFDNLERLKELTNIWTQEVWKGKNMKTQEYQISKLNFSYDNINNILSNWENNYSYDELSRLTSIDKWDSIIKDLNKNKQEQLSIDYNYDNIWNRDSVEQTLSWSTKKGKEKEKTRIADYTNNNLNQYTSITTQNKTKQLNFKYDNNWNLIKDDKQLYTYDYRNRLVKVESYEVDRKWKISTNLILEFKYDILGRRISKTTYNDDEIKKIIKYTYSNQDAIQETVFWVRNNKEVLKNTKEYIYWKWIDDVIVMILITWEWKKRTENKFFYQKDQLGSITAITNKDGKVIKQYTYDEFGKAYERKEKSEHWREYSRVDIDNTRLFTGREYDKEIWLYYYRARYYSADLWRFISRDPIWTRDDINLYSYVGNNPLKFVDSMGREKSLIILTIDRNWFIPTFDSNWYALNWETSYVASMYNYLLSSNPNKKFDVKLITDFSSFDSAINEKNRDDIYFIGHWSQDSISLNNGSVISSPESNISLTLDTGILNSDTQTLSQTTRLSNTSLHLLSCETWDTWLFGTYNPIAQKIENHYWFKETIAPNTFIHWNNEVYNDYNLITAVFWIKFWEFNTFISN